MKPILGSACFAAVLAVVCAPAYAQIIPAPAPEPETLALLAIGVVGAIAVKLKRQRK